MTSIGRESYDGKFITSNLEFCNNIWRQRRLSEPHFVTCTGLQFAMIENAVDDEEDAR